MDRKHCTGCRDNFYNGNNPYDISECWLLKSAKLVKKKRVDINQRPPWKQPATTVPNCYKEVGYVYVGPHQEC